MLDLTTFTASECLIYLLIKPVKVTVSDNIDRISREEPATMTKMPKFEHSVTGRKDQDTTIIKLSSF